jgi:uncharacterized protein (TIGR02466 family)
MILDIFKTSIYKTSFKDEKYIDYFVNLLTHYKNNNQKENYSNIGGFQSISSNIIDEEIKQNLFIKPAEQFIKQFKQNLKIELSNFWLNCNTKDDYNILHHHNNSNISGVYYVKAPKNSGNIVFQNGDLTKMYCKNQFFFNDINFHSRFFLQIEQYDLILFSSETLHYVEPNKLNEERISVAFNLKFV